MDDLISVIIPVYNAAEFIERAVDSVRAQSYKNWEIVIVENGSTDDSANVCKAICSSGSDGRISLYHSDKGVSRARNFGIDKAGGKWICFLDADDVFSDNALFLYADAVEKAVRKYEDLPDIVFAKHMNKKNAGKVKNEMRFLENEKQMDCYIAECLCNPTKQCTTHVELFRKDFLTENKLFFREKLTHGEDSVFLMECMKHAKFAVVTDYMLYHVIPNPDSAVRGAKKDFVGAYRASIAEMSELLGKRTQEIDNALNIYILSQLLIIFVHDTFSGKGSTGRAEAKKLLGESPFCSAAKDADLSLVGGIRKLVFGMMKQKRIFLLYLAVKFRRFAGKERKL